MKNQAKKIVTTMIENDNFSKWLGIEVIHQTPGSSILKMSVRKEMLNGFHILHGGISYALADSALAFASNCHGRKSVSLETSISYIESWTEADVLTAEAKEVSLSDKIGIYHVKVKSQHQKTIALFKGTVYRTNKKLK